MGNSFDGQQALAQLLDQWVRSGYAVAVVLDQPLPVHSPSIARPGRFLAAAKVPFLGGCAGDAFETLTAPKVCSASSRSAVSSD